MENDSKRRVVVIGAGGNIGSHLIPLLGRMKEVAHVILVDRDAYEEKNLHTQNIVPEDIGKPKVWVMSRRLRRINPDLEVVPIFDTVENVPLGLLRGDVILAGLDSRRARQVVNERAWRLGIPHVDAGVDGENLLIRINIYVPGPNRPCLQCAWCERDYERLKQLYKCSGEPEEPPETNAPSFLGSLAASLLANECRKILIREYHRVAVGRQVLMDISHHRYYLSRLTYNPNCRFPAHRSDPIQGLESCTHGTTLGDLLATRVSQKKGTHHQTRAPSIQVIGQTFVRRLICTECGYRRSFLRLRASLRSHRPYKCNRCGKEMVVAGFESAHQLEAASLSSNALRRSLRSLGVRESDVVCVHKPDNEDKCYEIVREGR